MKTYKLILYAIYFILLDSNKMSFKDTPGYGNLYYFLSLIFIVFSVGLDLYNLIERFKNR